MLIYLFDEERITLRVSVDGLHKRRRRHLAAERLEHLRDTLFAEAPEHDLSRATLSGQRLEHLGERPLDIQVDVPVGADEKQRHLRRVLCDVLQQQQRRFIGPVQIIDEEYLRRHARGAFDILHEAVEEIPPLLLRWEISWRGEYLEAPVEGLGRAVPPLARPHRAPHGVRRACELKRF